MKKTIAFTLNGKPVSLSVGEDRFLLWVLRTDLGLTGTKWGCEIGACGACTVVVDGEAVRSCRLPMKDVAGKSVITIEGLARAEKLHPLQEAFIRHDALQCGYCTPGMILTAYSLLLKNPKPGPEEIKAALEYNLCRCGAHPRIVRAIQDAAGTGPGGGHE